MSVELVSSSRSEERPVSVAELSNVLAEPADSKELIGRVLAFVQTKSSKHKFVVQATKVASDGACDVGTAFGAAWDLRRDGYMCVSLGGGGGAAAADATAQTSVVLTLYWIYVS